MLRVGIVVCLVAAALATPATRYSEDVKAFRNFLESTTKANDAVAFTKHMEENPKALPWENSGRFQGDMLLDDFQIEALTTEYASGNRNAYIWPNTKWPNNVIPYAFQSGHFTNNQRTTILNAMKEIEDNTCIRFVERNNEFNYVLLTGRSDGCYANVGYWAFRGVHTLNLAPFGCLTKTTIVHEWLHIIGFMHMQSTHNRDDWVNIMWQNIQPGMEHNFDKYDTSMVDNLGLPYEYGSCMHYGGFGFSINGQPTMVALYDTQGVMGQTTYVSDLDYLRARRHVNCPGAWSKTAQETQDEVLPKLSIVEQPEITAEQ